MTGALWYPRHEDPFDPGPEDPASWPYSDRNGPFIDRIDGNDGRPNGHGPELLIDPADLAIGPREVLCATCWCFHRPEIDCQG